MTKHRSCISQLYIELQNYQVRQNKVAPLSFSLFSQQPFGTLINLGQPATGTDGQGCEKLLKATEKACVGAGGGHFEHSQ